MILPSVSVIQVRLTVLATCAVLACAPLAAIADGPFGELRLAANRSAYNGACPVEITFTANVNLNVPHSKALSFNYHWERSDGAKSATVVVRPTETDKLLIYKETWKLGAAGKTYDASVRFFVNSGNTHEQVESKVIKVVCK